MRPLSVYFTLDEKRLNPLPNVVLRDKKSS